jgi:hypothetical protein
MQYFRVTNPALKSNRLFYLLSSGFAQLVRSGRGKADAHPGTDWVGN